MKTVLYGIVAALVAAVAGCAGFETSAPPPPPTMNQAVATVSNKNPVEARQYLEQTAQAGETIGDLATPESQAALTVMADSIVVGLDGRGTNRYDPKARPELVKLLVKNFDSLDVASQIINSKDAAPVRVIAELPPFVRRGDKFDIVIQSLDPMVNLEGGTLVDTPLQRYIQMDPNATHQGFRTPGGLVSEGTEAYARGDVTLNPGYNQGRSVKGELPTVGYVPAGAMAEKTWGYRLMLKKPDSNTSLLINTALHARFDKVATSPNIAFIAIGMPDCYQSYWRRYLDVVVRVPVRLPSRQDRLREIERQAARLSSADPQVRYDAECTLDAYGYESAPALLETLRTSSSAARQSALRVLAFFGDPRCVEPLVDESRKTQGPFRAESAFLLSLTKGEAAVSRLLEMLGDDDWMTRFEALMSIDRLGVKEAPVKTYYSREQRNFAMYLIDAPGPRCIVLKSTEGVRRIALFGTGMVVKAGFRGDVGPAVVNVMKDTTEISLKHGESGAPVSLRTAELQNIVSALDQMNVSINDIIGLITQMSQAEALDAKLYWAD